MVAGLAADSSIIVPDAKLEGMGIKVIVGEVTNVNAADKKVTLRDNSTLEYNKLILTTGARSFVPPIEGHDLDHVVCLRGSLDAQQIRSILTKSNPRRMVFVGAGFITMEIASLLLAADDQLEITVVELLDRPLPVMLDKDMADKVSDYVSKKGINLLTGKKVERLLGESGKVKAVELESGEILKADVVFIHVGVRPNLELAEKAGLELGRFGIKVNEFQETSDPDILAGGDCVEKVNFITGKPDAGNLRGPAVMQGRLAAKRLAGYSIPFHGVLNAGGCQMFDMVVTATGLTEESAKTNGYETVTAIVESRSKHGMIPGMQLWWIKLVFDKATKKLIGGQIVSNGVGPAREIDAVSAFIMGGKTIEDLTVFTSACNPDISSEPSMEPITIAAEQALQKI
ncbi:FAD-dependent pyridine nucleotidedisulfide oxidoreductase [Desulfosarcina variabilis str. Montpellier]|uniref:FAD-dependent oxidoreductase n=1 Tax=Desulfosarcina variabilis TaxID=2300 RepID=UPI003AFABA95